MGASDSKEQTPIQEILIIIAMEAEAMPFIEHLKLEKAEPTKLPAQLPCTAYAGKVGDLKITVVTNGKDRTHGVDSVGTVSAAITAFAAVQAYKADLIINAGTAGGFKAMGANIGDVYISTELKNHDRRIPIPDFVTFATGAIKAVPTPNLAIALGLKQGVVTTGNSLDCTEKDAEIMKANGAHVKDMEGAALAYVADLCKIPFFSIKSVTDIVDGDRTTSEEFLENLAAAAKSLQSTLPKAIEFIAGKTVEQL
ncbi:hypothetical protein CYMTET_3724 [Cymbomonas tetramitiformis]|uniref:Nucleoside phosphorylase domain-containing protein n=1 Tax=Cymbomonas tetramitiformis TaxID=36881 RepID=A0AAE0LKR8_9CHLO|nr:hypothetical protein CYMTET_3724 [Cymbomonas tetramitiformis]